jgi:putative molybdopterin biosynthesis protein
LFYGIILSKGGFKMVLYTVKEVAEMLKMHKQTVHNMVIKGELESIKIGKMRRITQEQLNRFISKQK